MVTFWTKGASHRPVIPCVGQCATAVASLLLHLPAHIICAVWSAAGRISIHSCADGRLHALENGPGSGGGLGTLGGTSQVHVPMPFLQTTFWSAASVASGLPR